jgi:hypothetical protein
MPVSRWAAMAIGVAAAVTVLPAPATAATVPPIPVHTWFTDDPLTAAPAPTAGGAPVTVMMCAQQTGGVEVILAGESDITAIDPAGQSSPDDPAIARQDLQSWIPGPAVRLAEVRLDSGPQCFRIRLTFGAGARAGRWRLSTHLAAYGLSLGGVTQPLLPLSEQDDPFSLTVSVALGPPAPRPSATAASGTLPTTNPASLPAPGGPAALPTATVSPAGSGGGYATGAASGPLTVQLADPSTSPADLGGGPDDERPSSLWIAGVAFAVLCLGAAGAVLRGRRRT